jgi:hypothetical protein
MNFASGGFAFMKRKCQQSNYSLYLYFLTPEGLLTAEGFLTSFFLTPEGLLTAAGLMTSLISHT